MAFKINYVSIGLFVLILVKVCLKLFWMLLMCLMFIEMCSKLGSMFVVSCVFLFSCWCVVVEG